MIFSKIKTLKTALVTLVSTAALVAPAYGSWGKDALTLQEFLDTNNTFNKTMWVGAHNAYSADEWGYFDPNQTLKPRNLLEAGARQMEYDPVLDTDTLRLCHASCTAGTKKLNDGLDNIKNFLADHPNSVVFLKLQMDGALSRTGEKLENKLGDYIYKPRPGRIPEDPSCPGRHGIEPEYLTKADILAEGKNVIVFAGNGKLDNCPSTIGFLEWVHVGLEYQDTGWQKQFDKPSSRFDRSPYDEGRMTLIHDPNTFNSINGGATNGVFTRSKVDDYMESGLNVFELYNFNGMDTIGHEEVKAKNMVWSWLEDQPSGNGDCAILNGALRGFDDISCTNHLKYACYAKATDTWHVTTQIGHWAGGQQVCSAEFGPGVEFSVPTNPRLMEALLHTTAERVYVNYHDQSREGVWQANSSMQLTVHSTPPIGDTSKGNPIDYSYMIDRSLYTGRYFEVTAARIRAQDRVKGIELTFSNGTVMYYGGDSGDYTDYLPLGTGRRVTEVEVCMDRHSQEDRVHYLELRSNTGAVIGNGTRRGVCNTLPLNGNLMGFHGTAGDSYFNSLGFYTIDPVDSYETPGWFVTERPVDGFPDWSTASGVKMLSGDFDGDGLDDLLATGGPGWTTLPIAFSQGDGTFTVTNHHTYDFARWTGRAGVQVVAGDFDGDGMDDLAATGGSGWNTMLMAFSQGDGTFTVTNHYIGEFATWTQAHGVKVLSGDFNNDGRDDVAAVGGPGWYTQPIAFSHGNGTFFVTNHFVGAFPSWSRHSGAKVVTGDFNGDGEADIALAGGSGWTTQPVAYSRGDGTFQVFNLPQDQFPAWASNPSATLVGGDFNGDGKDDLAVTGGVGWTSVPMAKKSPTTAYFNFSNDSIGLFGQWTASAGPKVVGGDFNGDGKHDLAVTGIRGWGSIGVAFSKQQ